MNSKQMQQAAERLYNATAISLGSEMSEPEHDQTPSGFGVYALWGEKRELLYVGYARTQNRAKTAKYSGIKNRLHHHRFGGGSLGLLLLMVKIACKYEPEEWHRVASGEIGIHAASQKYVRDHMSYTFYETRTDQDAKQLEKWLHERGERAPLLNMLRKKFKKAAKI